MEKKEKKKIFDKLKIWINENLKGARIEGNSIKIPSMNVGEAKEIIGKFIRDTFPEKRYEVFNVTHCLNDCFIPFQDMTKGAKLKAIVFKLSWVNNQENDSQEICILTIV